MSKLIFFLLILTGLTSCKKNPVDRLTNPLPDGDVLQSSGIFTVYDDELKTGGGLSFIPGGTNQGIDLYNVSDPKRSNNHIQYIWNGQPVAGQQLFAGFQLTVTPDNSTLSSATGKNIASAGYTKLKLYIRGQLSSGNRLRIEGPDDGTGGITAERTELEASQISNAWQAVTLSIPSSHFNNVKIFITISIQYTQPPRTTLPGEGGVIYIDDIRYEI